MLIGMMSLAGVPFTAGFLGNFFIFDAAIRQHQTFLAVLGVITVGCGFYYYLKVVRATYWLEPVKTEPVPLSALSRLTMILLIVAIFVLGIYPQPELNALNQPDRAHHHFHVPLGENYRRTLTMLGLLQHFFHPTQCYALCAVARSGAHLLTGALQASHLAGRPLQYFHTHLAQKYAARYGLDAARNFTQYLHGVLKGAATTNGVFGFRIASWDVDRLVHRLRESGQFGPSDVAERGPSSMPRSPVCAALS